MQPNHDFSNDSNAIISSQYHCTIHKNLNSSGLCNICEQSFCEKCLKNFENLNFCPSHSLLFVENNWLEITSVKTSPDQPEEGTYIYKLKSRLWEELKIPTYIITHYKINMDNDFIESFIKLYVIKKDVPIVESELKKHKENQ